MLEVPTRRLIDAAATLPPAERALLNLWVQRGLDDHALAALGRMSPVAIGDRRGRIVAHLAEELGLPADHVRGVLDGIASSSAESIAASAATEPRPEEETPAPRCQPGRQGRPGHRGRWVLALAALVVIGIGVAITALAADGGRSRVSAFAALPGGPSQISGTVRQLGSVTHPELGITIRGVPAAPGGHYELWLYNSVIDSLPLAQLPAGSRRLVLPLPPGGSRYRSIDVSFQPRGAVNHSGESVLRAGNPDSRR